MMDKMESIQRKANHSFVMDKLFDPTLIILVILLFGLPYCFIVVFKITSFGSCHV